MRFKFLGTSLCGCWVCLGYDDDHADDDGDSELGKEKRSLILVLFISYLYFLLILLKGNKHGEFYGLPAWESPIGWCNSIGSVGQSCGNFTPKISTFGIL